MIEVTTVATTNASSEVNPAFATGDSRFASCRMK